MHQQKSKNSKQKIIDVCQYQIKLYQTGSIWIICILKTGFNTVKQSKIKTFVANHFFQSLIKAIITAIIKVMT